MGRYIGKPRKAATGPALTTQEQKKQEVLRKLRRLSIPRFTEFLRQHDWHWSKAEGQSYFMGLATHRALTSFMESKAATAAHRAIYNKAARHHIGIRYDTYLDTEVSVDDTRRYRAIMYLLTRVKEDITELYVRLPEVMSRKLRTRLYRAVARSLIKPSQRTIDRLRKEKESLKQGPTDGK